MIKLYEKQSYLKENITTVTSCESDGDRIYLTLEETIFFPEEGGQHADTGVIIPASDHIGNKSVHILNGEVRGDIIVYEVDCDIQPGTKVKCVLDWEKRFLRMQNHSGEHLFTGLVHNKYGYNNVGFHLSDDAEVTLDFDGILSYEELLEIEKLANEAIFNALPIKDTYPSREELSGMEYRSKIEIEGQVRLITIGNEMETLDVCACCAPHVADTSEIGLIKVVSAESRKGGVRVGIICGKRAYLFLASEHEILKNVCKSLSTAPENLGKIVDSHIDKISMLTYKIDEITEEKYYAKIDLMKDDDAHVVFCDGEISSSSMKNIYNYFTKTYDKYLGVFAGDDASGYKYYAGSGSMDAGILGSLMREKLGAKGGGNAEMVQGFVKTSKDNIIIFWNREVKEII